MNLIPADLGGDLYLVNGNMLPLFKSWKYQEIKEEENE
jgi:hypothetical protein